MTVTAAAIKSTGVSGSHKPNEIGEYRVEYLVTTSTSADGAQTVLDSPLLPQGGDYYDIGNAEIDFNSTVQSRDASPVSPTRWLVRVNYGKRDSDGGQPVQDVNGNPTNIPLDERAVFSVESRLMTRVAEDGIYMGQAAFDPTLGNFTNEVPIGDASQIHRQVGSAGAITNSALVPFDPPPEYEYAIRIIRIRRPASAWDEGTLGAYHNSVNKTPVTLTKLNFVIPEYSGRLFIKGAEEDKNGFTFWRENYEIHVDAKFGFYVDLLDRGFHRRAAEYDLDEDGELITGAAINTNASRTIRLKDQNGAPVTEPQLLDGDGSPLPAGDAPVYLRYEPNNPRDWAPLQLDAPGRVF